MGTCTAEVVGPRPCADIHPLPLRRLLLSAISLWEFAKLLEKRRLAISCDPEEWIREALEMPGLRLVPLSPSVAYRSTILPQPFHDDPADQIIVATARGKRDGLDGR